MAKIAMKEREKKKLKLVNKYREERQKLKKIIKSSNDFDEIQTAQEKLAKLPVNSNPVRHTKRCRICGRPHAVYKKFGLCRIHLREQLMYRLNVPGARKSSW